MAESDLYMSGALMPTINEVSDEAPTQRVPSSDQVPSQQGGPVNGQSSRQTSPVHAVYEALDPQDTDRDVLPTQEELDQARASICQILPAEVQSESNAIKSIEELLKGLNRSSQSPRYYGFVTGGATNISQYADNRVTEYDQNVQVHLPNETIATDVEAAALKMLCQLYGLDDTEWNHRTFTTGATASNLLGLSIARQAIVEFRAPPLSPAGSGGLSIAHAGVLRAAGLAQIDEFQILATHVHTSIAKTASILGLGRHSIHAIGRREAGKWHLFDFARLESYLEKPRTASIIVVTSSEVDSGLFATPNRYDFETLRILADKYRAWIHVDAAIGLQARLLLHDRVANAEYEQIMDGVDGIELADSIAGDAHKLLNVPYDCGIFLSRHIETAVKVCSNAGAAYLATDADDDIPSPLSIGIENSRRFRALPVYANLIRYGRRGFEVILRRQIDLARQVAEFIQTHPSYELLPPLFGRGQQLQAWADNSSNMTEEEKAELRGLQAVQRESVFMIVCFRAVSESLNENLTQLLKDGRRIYVSPTMYDNRSATRIAIANWQVDVQRDLDIVCRALQDLCTT